MLLTVVLAAGLLVSLLVDALRLRGAASAETVYFGWAAYAMAVTAYVAMGVAAVRAWLSHGGRMIALATLLWGVATLAAIASGVWSWHGGLTSWCYLLGLLGLGALCRYMVPADRQFGWMDAGFLVLAAVPIKLGLIPDWSMPAMHPVSIVGPASIIPFLAISLALGALMVVRRLPDIGFDWSFRPGDFTTAAAFYATFVLLFGLPLGRATGLAGLRQADWSWWETVGSFCSLFFFPAVLEEFFFRGILLNLIAERLRGPWRTWRAASISAVVFGLCHLRQPHPFAYAGLACLAGLFYSAAYLLTGRLSVAALTHAMVDFTWIALFQG